MQSMTDLHSASDLPSTFVTHRSKVSFYKNIVTVAQHNRMKCVLTFVIFQEHNLDAETKFFTYPS